jgi:hypothetical protein
MFGRWSQENYFCTQESTMIWTRWSPRRWTSRRDASFPNPERAKPKAQLANLRAQLREAHESSI